MIPSNLPPPAAPPSSSSSSSSSDCPADYSYQNFALLIRQICLQPNSNPETRSKLTQLADSYVKTQKDYNRGDGLPYLLFNAVAALLDKDTPLSSEARGYPRDSFSPDRYPTNRIPDYEVTEITNFYIKTDKVVKFGFPLKHPYLLHRGQVFLLGSYEAVAIFTRPNKEVYTFSCMTSRDVLFLGGQSLIEMGHYTMAEELTEHPAITYKNALVFNDLSNPRVCGGIEECLELTITFIKRLIDLGHIKIPSTTAPSSSSSSSSSILSSMAPTLAPPSCSSSSSSSA